MLKIEELMTIKTLIEKGVSQRQIAKTLGISRNTVKKYLKREGPPQYRREKSYPSILDRHKEYLLERLREYPQITAERLHRELREKGFQGSYQTVNKFRANQPPGQRPPGL
ncbi:MAG: transposase [FCB group bacterium]|nr:transposase [FCB group bacterium]